MKELPTFNGYTIDVRLREFRRASPEAGLEVIPFVSDNGKQLIDELYALYREIDIAVFEVELQQYCE